MLASTITRKGQVTIPKEIRLSLGLSEGQRVFFVRRGKEVLLRVLRGNILDLRGSVKPLRRPEDFEEVREVAKKGVSARVVQAE